MRVKIENDRVHQNVLIFLELASRIKDKASKEKLSDRTHAAFLNRVNGEIYFLELLPDTQALHSKDWKKIELCFIPDPVDEHLSIEVQETEAAKFFAYEELTPLAYRVMTETIKTLNQITRSIKQAQGFESLELSSFPGDVIQSTWHDVDRMEAEAILAKHPYGSYLFRCDEYARLLSENLSRQLKRRIEIYTLTFSEPERKVSDLTIVHEEGRWLIYNDDPNLSGHSYASLEEILAELKTRCSIPVFH